VWDKMQITGMEEKCGAFLVARSQLLSNDILICSEYVVYIIGLILYIHVYLISPDGMIDRKAKTY